MVQNNVDSFPDLPGWIPKAMRVSDLLRRFVDRVGRFGSWMILPVVLITVFDASMRKISTIQVWMVENVSFVFGSTILQELQWHFHTALFALVLGYGYINNTHVRVDLVREKLAFHKKVWLEFLGLTIFMIPFCLIIIWFAVDWVHTSYALGEISASQVGLTHRWIIKSVLLSGLCVAAVAGVSVWLQVAVVIWGPQDMRFQLMTLEWPEEEQRVEGKKRIVLDEEPEISLGGPPGAKTVSEASSSSS